MRSVDLQTKQATIKIYLIYLRHEFDSLMKAAYYVENIRIKSTISFVFTNLIRQGFNKKTFREKINNYRMKISYYIAENMEQFVYIMRSEILVKFHPRGKRPSGNIP